MGWDTLLAVMADDRNVEPRKHAPILTSAGCQPPPELPLVDPLDAHELLARASAVHHRDATHAHTGALCDQAAQLRVRTAVDWRCTHAYEQHAIAFTGYPAGACARGDANGDVGAWHPGVHPNDDMALEGAA
jgi:hypothetical protein